MTSPLQFIDGYLGAASEISVVPLITYPFGANPVPDIYHRRIARRYHVDPRSFSPRIAARALYNNFLLWSTDLNNAAWVKYNVALAAHAARNLGDGSTGSVVSVTDSSAGVAGYIYQDVGILADGIYYCFSAFFLSGTSSRVRIEIDFTGGSGISRIVDFNPSTGAIISGSGEVRPYTIDGKLWFRVAVALANDSTNGNVRCVVWPSPGAVGDVGGVGVYGLQLNGGNQPAPYISTTSAGRTISAPDVDSFANPAGADPDPFAYLVAESDLTYDSSLRALFTRLYARIPADQVFPSAKYISRPALHDIKSGSAYAVSFDAAKKFSWVFTSRKSVTALNTPDVTRTTATNSRAALASSQTINVTGTSGSSSFTTSSTVAAIQAAIAAAWAFCWVRVIKDSFRISIYLEYGGAGGGSLTSVSSSSTAVQISGSALNWDITSIDAATATVRSINANAHGGVAGNRVALWNNDHLFAMGMVVSVADANNFSVEIDAIPGKDDVVTHCAFSPAAAACVVNGSIMCSIRRTQKYFLPGVSVGITTAADIPALAVATDPISWLAAIIASSAWVVESVGDLVPAPGLGAMVMQETIEVQMSDALDLVTP